MDSDQHLQVVVDIFQGAVLRQMPEHLLHFLLARPHVRSLY